MNDVQLLISDLLLSPHDRRLVPGPRGPSPLLSAVMRELGENGLPGVPARPAPRVSPLAFGLAEAERERERSGFNCGPGALAAAAGVTPERAVAAIPGFARRGHTTETMMALGLAGLGLRFRWVWTLDGAAARPAGPALVRVVYGDGSVLDRLRRSHWVMRRPAESGGEEVFDVNAIRFGGWMSDEEWRTSLAPWLGDTVFGGLRVTSESELFALASPAAGS
ncbi:MAG: hypothetical protein DI629_20705 [Mesorhizobium amorphae]|nr:MAG: hypothetical protein DI629_20705 [Mesorhizobium amorphae]